MTGDTPTDTFPRYLGLLASGEFERRVAALEQKLKRCQVCPRHCEIDRTDGFWGFCRSGDLPVVSSVCDHHGEEPCLSGTRGAGNVFFGNCNLKCVYCQNYQISQNRDAQRRFEMTHEALAERLLGLQARGCHNINFVSPSHFVPHMAKALFIAAKAGLRLPVVYNTNGYDDLDSLRLIDGMVDVYLPDAKYASDAAGARYSGIPDYWTKSQLALKEMYRQVGLLETGEDGMARRGLIVRHLVLPNGVAESFKILAWIRRELSPRVTISLMAQYYPTNKTTGERTKYPELSRKITPAEYDAVHEMMEDLGMTQGFYQNPDEAPDNYQPDFDHDHPFHRDAPPA